MSSGAVANEAVTLRRFHDVRAALNDRALARSIDPERFEIGNITESTLSVLHGDEHRNRRRVENQLFRRSTLESYERVLFPSIVESTLSRFVGGAESDLMEIGGLLTVVLAARTAGVDFDVDSLAARQDLRSFLHTFALASAIDVVRGDVDEVKARMRAALRDFTAKYVNSSWARREKALGEFHAGRLAEDELPRDALTTLLRARHDGQLAMDDALVIREVRLFFSGGAHTSTQTLTNTFDRLFTWCQAHPEDWDRLGSDLYFAQHAVQEALRCRPTNPLIHRRAIARTAIGGHEISAGTLVLLDTVAANTDPDVYGPDAAAFNPHRNPPADAALWGMSFGHGMHLCIGRTLSVGMPVGRDDDVPSGEHLYGLIPQAVQALVRRGIRPDPLRPPARDTQTDRWTRWASYPVCLRADQLSMAPG